MQSKANTGYLATFAIGDNASPIDYTPMAELASIKPSNFTIPAIDTTHLQSPNATEEMIPGLIKPGAIAITGNFTGDATQLNIATLAQSQSLFPWKITSKVNKGTQLYTAMGTGFITKYETGPFEPNKKIDFAADIQITGNITETVV
jgi:Lambda phage tail tube protein, TTP